MKLGPSAGAEFRQCLSDSRQSSSFVMFQISASVGSDHHIKLTAEPLHPDHWSIPPNDLIKFSRPTLSFMRRLLCCSRFLHSTRTSRLSCSRSIAFCHIFRASSVANLDASPKVQYDARVRVPAALNPYIVHPRSAQHPQTTHSGVHAHRSS